MSVLIFRGYYGLTMTDRESFSFMLSEDILVYKVSMRKSKLTNYNLKYDLKGRVADCTYSRMLM